MVKSAIIISVSSDIGAELCKDWTRKGWTVAGTYRTPSPLTKELGKDAQLIPCDLADKISIEQACVKLNGLSPQWDVLVFGVGCLDPVGKFEDVEFDQWEKGIEVNFLSVARIVHRLLPTRNPSQSTVLFFAGAGTNGPAPCYSSYSLSKIGLIKMCELLDAEIPDVTFGIVGPGWVKTKIHRSTLEAGQQSAADNYQITLDRLSNNDFTPMQKVIECCNWFFSAPPCAVGGRNFSVVFDQWGTKELEQALATNPDMYKLRRSHNESLSKRTAKEKSI